MMVARNFFFLLPVLMAVLFFPPAVRAQDDPDIATAKTLTITSLQKCYDQISHEDALDIQRNYIKPWQECRRRLSLKLKNDAKSKKTEADTRPPATPRNFYRVQNTPRRDSSEEAKKPAKPATSPPPE